VFSGITDFPKVDLVACGLFINGANANRICVSTFLRRRCAFKFYLERRNCKSYK